VNLPLKGFKGNKFEGGHRVPFFVHWPARVPGGRRFDGLSSSMDLFATSLSAAGIRRPADLALDGVDLLPYLTGQAEGHPHSRLFFRKEEGAAMREGNWKLIRVDGVGAVLYDLSRDPGETTDLSASEPVRFAAMSAALAQWETGLATPWWRESRAWQDVTKEIHESLMRNLPVKRVSP
jgi:arylsulfatase A-like enzyme